MQGNNQSGINDDELNKMIASIQQEQRQGGNAVNGEKVIQPPATSAASPLPVAPPIPPAPAAPLSQPVAKAASVNTDIANMTPTPLVNNPQAKPVAPSPIAETNLEELKRETIAELRPLVDKLNIDPADKFDALLLMIRTTDDGSLLVDAHKTAMQIADDSRRAQALLDVIKEIDFFSSRQQ